MGPAYKSYARSGFRRVEGWVPELAMRMIVEITQIQSSRGVRGAACEIGVHHGRTFILLHLLTVADELCVGFDLYEQQQQAGQEREARLRANLQAHAGDPDRIRIVSQNSLQLQPPRIVELCAGQPRLFSIDGGRDARTIYNDLVLAHDTVCPGAVVMVDDYFQESWPEVSEGMCRFMAQSNRHLHPVAIGGNKIFLASSPEAAQTYRDELAVRFSGQSRWSVMFGERVLVVRPPTLRTRVGRMKRMISKALAKIAGARRVQMLRALLERGSTGGDTTMVCEPGGGKIMVLAPHMDDEVLGCGGTIARHAQAGAHVCVVFLTDGRYGGTTEPGLSEANRELKRRELIETRKQEARSACALLGVATVIFLDAEDTRLRMDALIAARLHEILERELPDIVYLPFFVDRHMDHRAATDVLLAATANTTLDFECRGYEVWTPLLPNCLVAIDATMELKQRALSCYRSQLALMDYLHVGTGLNAYRSAALGNPACRFAEAFHALALAEYRQFYRAVCRAS